VLLTAPQSHDVTAAAVYSRRCRRCRRCRADGRRGGQRPADGRVGTMVKDQFNPSSTRAGADIRPRPGLLRTTLTPCDALAFVWRRILASSRFTATHYVCEASHAYLSENIFEPNLSREGGYWKGRRAAMRPCGCISYVFPGVIAERFRVPDGQRTPQRRCLSGVVVPPPTSATVATD
jgi:hypothetical protein